MHKYMHLTYRQYDMFTTQNQYRWINICVIAFKLSNVKKLK